MKLPTFTLRSSPLLLFLGLLSVAVWVASILELVHFVVQAVLSARLSIHDDEALYFGMGRGLLNGWHMYSDLFETKPPLIFWLSALSLLVTGGDTLLRLLQAVGLGAIPFALSFFALRRHRSGSRTGRVLFSGISFLFGAALATFAVSRSDGFQPEGFGIIAAACALGTFAGGETQSRQREIVRIVAIAVCLTTAILMKEPFALSIVGGLLPLTRSRHDLFVIGKSVALAGVLWLGILALTGTASAYFSVYLPEIFAGRLSSELLYHDYGTGLWYAPSAPVWVRGLNIYVLFRDLFFSPFVLLALSLAVLILILPAVRAVGERAWVWRLLGTTIILSAVVFTNMAFTLEQVVAILHFIPWSDSFFQRKCLELGILGLACVAPFLFLLRYSAETARRVAAIIGALYLGSTAVAVGGNFVGPHFLFAVPVYLGCFIAWSRDLSQIEREKWTMATVAIVGLLLILNSLNANRFDYAIAAGEQSRQEQVAHSEREQAAHIDAILDACDVKRYFHFGGNLTGLTEHSPYQLAAALGRVIPHRDAPVGTLKAPNPFFLEKFRRDFAETPVVLSFSASTSVLDALHYPDLQDQFRTQFSLDAPSCAKPFLPIPGVHVFFRQM